ncbi:MAG TPA: lysylphosphatidylglycerol synthase transmembrane domain-containing protein [Blastocatellia bacterium]|nr:lysylphosphatidylglycerol synthase transmembrane domain-containing protein [Blastocatellia bacterium]
MHWSRNDDEYNGRTVALKTVAAAALAKYSTRFFPDAVNTRLKSILSLLVGAIFVYWFVHKLNWRDVAGEVKKANWQQLALAVALLVGTYWVRVLRWRVFLEPMARPPLLALFRATMMGFSALFVMGRAAEMIVRPAALSVKSRVHPSASYATVMIERVFDMVMVVVFFAVNLIFFEYVAHDADAMRVFGWIKVTGVMLLLVAAAGIYGLSAFRTKREGALAFLETRLNRLPTSIARGLLSLLRHISEGLAVLHDARSLTITVGYTVLLWLMVSLAHLLVVRAFGVPYEAVPFTGAVFLMGLSMLGSVIPTPGGATGPFHTATAAALSFLGIEQNKSASIAITLHLLIFAPATFFGLYYLAKEGLSLDRLKLLGERQVDEDTDKGSAGQAVPEQEAEEAFAARG